MPETQKLSFDSSLPVIKLLVEEVVDPRPVLIIESDIFGGDGHLDALINNDETIKQR